MEEIKDCLDCGIPISVCVFTDAKGKPMISTNFIGEQGCLPCGYRTEPHPANGSADIKVVAKTLTWKIPVCWSMMATIEVEAATLAEAIEIAKDDNGEIPLPDGVFQDGSWEVDCSDKDYIRQWYNDDQADLDLSEAESGDYSTKIQPVNLANNALINNLAAEHLRCGNCFGDERKPTEHIHCRYCNREITEGAPVFDWGGDQICEDCCLEEIIDAFSISELASALNISARYADE